jgi:hypothetical protein
MTPNSVVPRSVFVQPHASAWGYFYVLNTPRLPSLCENSSFKCGAGYQPAAAHRTALVFDTEKPAGSRLRADGPPHKVVFKSGDEQESA